MNAHDTYEYGSQIHASAVSPQWPVSVRLAVQEETRPLRRALEDYEAIEADQIHPASYDYELRDHPEAKHAALGQAAEVIGDLAGELVRVFPACEVKQQQREVAA